jgi:UDP:flavonoid glycosyltransferase YjiC (YdhE family)
MRLMFSSTGGWGHVLPMLPLALAARDRGHDVIWATAVESCQLIEAEGVAAAPAGRSAESCIAEYARRWPEATEMEGRAATAHMFGRLFGAVAAEAAVGDIELLAREWKPDVIVHEAAEFAAPAVAAAAGIPSVTHGFGLLIPAERVSDAGERAAPVWRRLGVEPRAYGGCYEHLYIDICPPSMQADDLSHVGRRTPLQPAAPMAGRTGAGVLLLTLGTAFRDYATTARVARALARLNASVVLTLGPGGDIAAVGPLPANVEVATVIQYRNLLPRCSIVVSHAGAGVMLKSLAAGLPQLCLPQSPSDQFRNAAACAARGAGLALIGAEASDDAIEFAARRLLDEPSFRVSAESVRAEIAAMPTPASVVARLERQD